MRFALEVVKAIRAEVGEKIYYLLPLVDAGFSPRWQYHGTK